MFGRTLTVMEGKQVVINEVGCPQGSILSTTLSNIYLHEVVDSWFKQISETHFKWKAEMIRYCDDMIFIFQNKDEAKRFYDVLPKRLSKYGLTLHDEKSHLIASGHMEAKKANQIGKRLPTYQFLGFTCYWGKSRTGHWRLKLTSRQDRFTAKLKGLSKFLQKQLNTPNTSDVLKMIVRVLRGWINYHGISDNGRRVRGFIWPGENHPLPASNSWYTFCSNILGE